MKAFFNVLCSIIILSSPIVCSQPKGITAEDLYSIKFITDVAISPDNKKVAYVVQKIDSAMNQYRSNIWMMLLDRGASFQFTVSDGQNKAPSWSPDSRYLAFESTRSGKSQIWIISVDEHIPGEAWTLTNMASGAWHPIWSPDGTRMAFLSKVAVFPKNKKHYEKINNRFIDEKGKQYASDVKLISRLRYRQHKQYLKYNYIHIFTISINGGTAKQLTSGPFNNLCPAWSPDSKYIAFVSNRRGNHDFDNNTDICLVPAEGGEVRILTTASGNEQHPIWSPNGKMIAYIGNTRLNDFTEQRDLFVISRNGDHSKNLTRHFDRKVTHPKWLSNNRQLFIFVENQGNRHLFQVSIKGKIKKILGGQRQVQKFDISRNGKQLIFVASDNVNPSELYLASNDGKLQRRLTKINENFLRKRQVVEPEEFWYASFDGSKIHGWIIKPPGFKPEKKYPLIVEIHGGPYWNYGNVWFHEFQFLAACGYAVFYCNPRVSTGYGQEFAQKDHGRWGEGDYQDIMAGVDAVLKMGFVDSTRMGVTGGSYGGYMTNWILGHTNRFKAAVTQRSLSNLISFYGTTDIQNFMEYEFGLPWKNQKNYLKHSPISYLQNIQTPLLIIHSELDFRVPISQAEELYVGLRRRGVEAEFVRYPKEGHELSRSGQPLHRVDRLNRIMDWFDRHLK